MTEMSTSYDKLKCGGKTYYFVVRKVCGGNTQVCRTAVGPESVGCGDGGCFRQRWQRLATTKASDDGQRRQSCAQIDARHQAGIQRVLPKSDPAAELPDPQLHRLPKDS